MLDAVCSSSRTLKCSELDATRRITAMNKYLYNKRDNRVLAMKVSPFGTSMNIWYILISHYFFPAEVG